MKRERITIILLALLLLLAGLALARVASKGRRLGENYRELVARNEGLADSLRSAALSVARLRMSVGELEEFRARDAEEIRRMGLLIGRTQSLTKVVSRVEVDTTICASEAPFSPILSDSLYRLRWRDGWVSLEVNATPTLSRVAISSRDTLLQVVHRVPHRWWLFSWGTKAIRQEIRSSNPHTSLVYAEYIEIDK